jgi:two-component sensor histidine kinase
VPPAGLLHPAEFIAVAAAYFVLAKLGLQLASINPSATPVWPPTGLALAAVLLRGYPMAAAVFIGAFAANFTTAGTVWTSLAIGLGNTLECLIGSYVINRWSSGRATFETPAGVARFAVLCLAFATPVSATIGVTSLAMAGFAEWQNFSGIWATWWLGDLAGAILFTPLLVLWANSLRQKTAADEPAETAAVFFTAVVIGLVAFSPLIEQSLYRSTLGFLAMLPLLWAALRRNQRDTATVAVILCGFALWGAAMGGGPFVRGDPNESFLVLLVFLIGTSLPSLALSADSAAQKRAEAKQSLLLAELSHRVKNTLSIVQSLAARTLTPGRSPEEAMIVLTNRLVALSHAHDLLIQTSWQGARLNDLFRMEINTFSDRISADGPDIMLQPSAVQTFALLIHELATNSSKHGALSSKNGKVSVCWSINGTAAEPGFQLEWTESGGPEVKPPSHRGFGLTLMERVLKREFSKQPEFGFHPGGFQFRLQVPLDSVMERRLS